MNDDDIPPHQRDFDEVARLVDDPAADIRLVTMLGVGYLEKYVVELTERFLPGLTDDWSKRFYDQSFRGVWARVDLAHALGAIAPKVANDLKVFIQIRNKFAHHIHIRDCANPDIVGLIRRLETVNEVAREIGSVPSTTADFEKMLRLMIAGTLVSVHNLISNPFKTDIDRNVRSPLRNPVRVTLYGPIGVDDHTGVVTFVDKRGWQYVVEKGADYEGEWPPSPGRVSVEADAWDDDQHRVVVHELRRISEVYPP